MVGERSATPHHLLIECGLTSSSPSLIAAGAAKDQREWSRRYATFTARRFFSECVDRNVEPMLMRRGSHTNQRDEPRRCRRRTLPPSDSLMLEAGKCRRGNRKDRKTAGR